MIMKKNWICFLAISTMISLFAVSCSKVETSQGSSDNIGGSDTETMSYTLTAGIEDAALTKTAIGEADGEGMCQVEWALNDAVTVLYNGGLTTAEADAAGPKADFSFDAPAGDVWFVYPAGSTSALSEGKLSLTIPAVQDGSFANHGYMVAKSNTSSESMLFFNACSMFKIVVSDATLTKAVITGNNGEKLAGTVGYTWPENNYGAPVVDLTAAEETSLTVNFSGVGEYLVAALPGLDLAEGVTIKFYRSDEPAGGNATESALAVERAKIASFGDSDAICNRYVSNSGTGSDNGRTPAKAWNLSQFKSFMEGTAVTGARLAAMDGVTIHFAAGTYSPSGKFAPNIAIKTTLVGESANNTIFDGASDKILFDIYKVDGEVLGFKNFTFQKGHNSSSEGGAFRIGAGTRTITVSFEDCNFINNKASSSSKGQGGALYIGGNSRLGFKGCSFGDGTSANKNSASQGGVMYIGGTASASFEDCLFNCNEASGTGVGGACLYVNGSGNQIKMNRCLFRNNAAVSRGVIQLVSNALVYMNRVSFTGNSTSASSSPWGLLLHGGTSFFCMNNVTAFGNENTYQLTKDCATLNCDAGMLLTNSTFVDFGGQYIVRVNDVSNSGQGNLTLCNNIFINRSSGKADSPFWVRNTITINNYGHNLRSSSSANGNVPDSNPASDCFNQSHETLGGDWTEVWNGTNGRYAVYAWTNSLTGFTLATSADVEGAMKACTASMAGVTAVGADFYNWLVGLGEFGNDGRGQSRGTGGWWPGAYHN